MTETIQDIWAKCLRQIQNELTDVGYKTWFSSLEPVDLVDDQFLLLVTDGNPITRSILESRYQTLTRNVLTNVLGRDIQVAFYANLNELPDYDPGKVKQEIPLEKDSETTSKSAYAMSSIHSNLNERYTFENFVIGENNRFAHAASVAVAEAPSEQYNPLFIYGGVGLGKTHLMQAIGNYIDENTNGKKVVYISCETFTNEFIDAIKNKNSEAFRNKYRKIDVLLVDDIQFLAGKEGTQEEFFHTFNALHDVNKQIVITSDRPPREIPNLAERLRSRFEMGLITDISAPNFETRIAILRKKAESYNDEIPDEVLDYIANNIQSNIRELEGALTTAVAYARLSGQKLSMQNVKTSLKEFFSKGERIIDAEYIKETTAKYFNITVDEMDSKSRKKTISRPRQVAMYLTRKLTDLSLPQIGRAFGGRDHTTILHGCQKISEDMDVSTDFKNLVIRIEGEITKDASPS